MKTILRFTLLGTLLLFSQPLFSQYDLSLTPVWGANGWMNDNVGDAVNNYNCYGFNLNPPIDCSPGGVFNTTIMTSAACSSKVKNLYVKLIRYGGHQNDVNAPTYSQYIEEIDKIRLMGAEPIIQVPAYNGTSGPYTAVDAKNLITYLNVTRGRNIKYVQIGNEPDLYPQYKTYSANDSMGKAGFIAGYFIPFADSIKRVDANIKIIGPSFSQYDRHVYHVLMTHLGTSNIVDSWNGNYWLDIVDVHRYPFDGTNTQIASSIIQDPQVSTYSSNFLGTVLVIPGAHGLLDHASVVNTNGYRSSSPLQYSMSEMNVDWKNPTSNTTAGVGTNGFIAGQWMAEMYAVMLDQANAKGVKLTFVSPWSFYESSGNETAFDLGILDGNSPCSSSERSTYMHIAMMAQYFKGNFYMGTDNTSNNPHDVKVFGSYLANGGFAIMIMNQSTSSSYTNYSVSTGTSYAGTYTTKMRLNSSVSYTYNSAYSLGTEETHLILLDCSGNLVQHYRYNRVTDVGNHSLNAFCSTCTSLPISLTMSSVPTGCTSPNLSIGSATVNINPSGSYNYSWSNGSTGTATTAATISNLSAGTYSVWVSNQTGCTAQVMASQIITGGAPSVTITTTNPTCSTASWTASATGLSPFTYSWSDGSTTSTSNSHTQPSNNTSATYTVTVTDTKGCTNTATATNYGNISTPTINSGTTSTGSCCSVSLTANFIPGAIYSWYFNSSFNSKTTTNTFSDPFIGPGNFQVKIELSPCNVTGPSSTWTVSNNNHPCSCGRTADLNLISQPIMGEIQSLVPNPSTGNTIVLYSLSDDAKEAALMITNVYGQLIRMIPIGLKDDKTDIDLSGFADGIYFVTLQINNSQNISTKKLVLQH